jgi:transposase
MPRKRSTYPAEYKLAAVKMVTDQKFSVAEVPRRLGVGENLLRTWKKSFEERGNAAFPGQGNPTPAEGELRRLRAERDR